MSKKVIDKLNDGWHTEVGEGGQIELAQDETREPELRDDPLPDLTDIPDDDELDDEDFDDGDDEEFEDDDDDDDSGGYARAPVTSYHRYGTPYKNMCIVCGAEFESQRPARFCVGKPACRQRYNRQERAIKAAAAGVDAALLQLLGLLEDKNFGQLSKNLLLRLEKSMLQRLDEKLPGRHPKKELTAIPVRIDPAELEYNAKAFVMVGSKIRAVKVQGIDDDDDQVIQCAQFSNGYGGQRMLIARSATWLRVVDPAYDDD